tara:strand:- start:110 stop:517 length:408 start_codon:yes stop_codon:yes gene_type:complete
MIINGDNFVDERGVLSFVNDFDFDKIKRFYQISNHKKNYIRAWHGHKNETKFFYVSSGTILLGQVNLDTEKITKYILSCKKPRVIKIEPNHANGFMNLTSNTNVIVFSDRTLDESKEDDIRYPYDKWDIWTIENY